MRVDHPVQEASSIPARVDPTGQTQLGEVLTDARLCSADGGDERADVDLGISLGLSYLGLPKVPGVVAAAVLVIASVSTGSFRRFERISLIRVAGSFTLIPIFVAAHPPVGRLAHDFLVPGLPGGSDLSTMMLLIIAIVGTTVAPWQLFFQQSYRADLADPHPVHVHPDADPPEITLAMADDNLLVLPVPGRDDRLIGVLTIEDILEAAVAPEWRRRRG